MYFLAVKGFVDYLRMRLKGLGCSATDRVYRGIAMYVLRKMFCVKLLRYRRCCNTLTKKLDPGGFLFPIQHERGEGDLNNRSPVHAEKSLLLTKRLPVYVH